MAPTDYIIFTHQLEERAQQMGPLLITMSTCSEGESGGLRQHVFSCVIGFFSVTNKSHTWIFFYQFVFPFFWTKRFVHTVQHHRGYKCTASKLYNINNKHDLVEEQNQDKILRFITSADEQYW